MCWFLNWLLCFSLIDIGKQHQNIGISESEIIAYWFHIKRASLISMHKHIKLHLGALFTWKYCIHIFPLQFEICIMLLEGVDHQWAIYWFKGFIVLLDYDIVALMKLLQKIHVNLLHILEIVLGELCCKEELYLLPILVYDLVEQI